jgi:hypothetical protein
MSQKYNEQFEVSKFIGYNSNILEELTKQRLPPNNDNDFFSIPVTENYLKNKEEKNFYKTQLENEIKKKNNLINNNE